MTTGNIYSLGSSYVYRQYSMSTNKLFSLNYTISNQPASRRKSEIRLLSCQRTHYRNLERQKRQNRFKSSSFFKSCSRTPNLLFLILLFLKFVVCFCHMICEHWFTERFLVFFVIILYICAYCIYLDFTQ